MAKQAQDEQEDPTPTDNAGADDDLQDLLGEDSDDDVEVDGQDDTDDSDSADDDDSDDVVDRVLQAIQTQFAEQERKFTSELDRRINQLSNKSKRGNSQQTESPDPEPPTVTADGREAFREYLLDEDIKRNSEEWKLAVSLGMPMLRERVASGASQDVAAKQAAEDTVKRLHAYRKKVQKETVSRLRASNRIVEEPGKPPRPGAANPSNRSEFKAGAEKARAMGLAGTN